MAKSYATIADVEAIVGHPLNAADEARIDTLLEAATAAFDRETGQSFIDGTPVAAELRAPVGLDVWLGRYPVASVQAVRARPLAVGGTSTALVALQTYELVDPAGGRLRLGSGWEQVSVDYTPVSVPVPLDVGEAVARWAAYNLSAGGGAAAASGVDTLTVGDVSIRYAGASSATASASSGVQPAVARVLDRYRRAVWA